MKQKKFNLANEEGSVLAFSVVMLTVMIFLVSVISLTTVNRIAVARRVSENSRETSVVESLNANLEKTIRGIVLQTDELTRYYLSKSYYQETDTSGFDSGDKASFDKSLKALVDPSFQRSIQSAYNASGGNQETLKEIADLLFAHMLGHRVGNSSLSVGDGSYLYSFSSRTTELIKKEAAYAYGEGTGANTLSITCNPGFNARYSYDDLKGRRSGMNIADSSYLTLTMQALYELEESGNQITTDIQVLFTFPEYEAGLGSGVSYPNDSETLYNNVIHYNTNVLTYQ